MDGALLDGGLPRRGSLNSLHRQSSGSFSHSSRLNSPAANGLQANNANLNNLYKDLDKFTRYFIIKTVQVIVQSRIGSNKRLKTECKPTGNDWFNINITDIAEVSDKTKAALDADGFSVRSNWRVCCEISLRTNDGGRVILEHWIISNKSNFSSSQNLLSSKLNNNNSVSPKTQSFANRSSQSHLTSSNGGVSPLNANNTTHNRVRYATFSSTTPRTRLNSIDDCSGDKNFSTNKLLVGTNNENYDIKSSTSCFSLSTTPANLGIDQTATAAAATANAATTITTSPIINSLPNNTAHNASSNNTNAISHQQQQQQQQGTKTGPMSSIYTIYNRMSLLLKTLMTTTHIVPAYRLASRAPQGDSCVICYRVYSIPPSHQANNKTNTAPAKGSIEDISYNTNVDSPTKRSSSTSSFGSVNIREFVAPDELDHFCPILKLGSIKTEVNELEVSLCYRTDVKNSNHLMRSPLMRDRYNKFLDEDCITAAKQLLAGNSLTNQDTQSEDYYETPDIDQNSGKNNEGLDYLDQPLTPAFAAKTEPKTDKTVQDPNLVIIDTAFDVLLQVNKSGSIEDVTSNNNNQIGFIKSDVKLCKTMSNGQCKSKNASSEPIEVPQTGLFKSKPVELCQNLSAGSTPKSLTDSFVFVDLNPPFASEEQNDINSFFHGPSPAFSNGSDSLKDVDELTNQLAVIEANASQIDEFIDNICVSEDEDEQD